MEEVFMLAVMFMNEVFLSCRAVLKLQVGRGLAPLLFCCRPP